MTRIPKDGTVRQIVHDSSMGKQARTKTSPALISASDDSFRTEIPISRLNEPRVTA
ncbi:hypothetical protein [Eleftheria terrae]|uniref:hypothetical protein n=1 Tax=Eleftheria terrae TaxID=1597781 RepID=UPI00263B837A|nr:hypothetical protein [Eleftheria terrae]WKB52803.1 hypothetical protein N7L95_24020 [Eleftheria terrae]